MKKIIIMTALALCLLTALAACGKDNKTPQETTPVDIASVESMPSSESMTNTEKESETQKSQKTKETLEGGMEIVEDQAIYGTAQYPDAD